jgi:hypothetical protein
MALVSLKEKAISLLSTTTVALNAVAATALYVVPNGKRCVLHGAMLVAGADASTSAVTIGKSTALTDFLGTQTLTGVNAQYDAVYLEPVPNATPVIRKSYAAGDIIMMDVTTGAGGASNRVDLFGYLY